MRPNVLRCRRVAVSDPLAHPGRRRLHLLEIPAERMAVHSAADGKLDWLRSVGCPDGLRADTKTLSHVVDGAIHEAHIESATGFDSEQFAYRPLRMVLVHRKA